MVFPDTTAAVHGAAQERTHSRRGQVSVLQKLHGENQLPVSKLVPITSDGAPAPVGRTMLSWTSSITNNMEEKMDAATKISGSIRARSLQRRLFCAHLEEAG